MKLSDTEKRELIRLIENGKSIPDEYRFKIFETKDEIDKDDRCTLEIEIFFGKKYVTVKVYERILN